jgi:hypothetical protein
MARPAIERTVHEAGWRSARRRRAPCAPRRPGRQCVDLEAGVRVKRATVRLRASRCHALHVCTWWARRPQLLRFVARTCEPIGDFQNTACERPVTTERAALSAPALNWILEIANRLFNFHPVSTLAAIVGSGCRHVAPRPRWRARAAFAHRTGDELLSAWCGTARVPEG